MKTFLTIVACLILTIIPACGHVPSPTPNAKSTASAVPTNTPIPTVTQTNTPLPTATPTKTTKPTPTATIEPPQLTSEFLSDVKVLDYDPFDNMNNWEWDSQTGNIKNGVFKLRGTSFWASWFSLNRQLKEGDGVMVRFKVQNANGNSEFVFLTGDWQTDSFRQFGIYNSKIPKADLFQGKVGLGGKYLHGNLTLKTETWCNLLMAIGKNGEFLAVMWDPTSESHRVVYNETIGKKWTGKSWYFTPKADEGETLYVDDFYRISFGEIK